VVEVFFRKKFGFPVSELHVEAHRVVHVTPALGEGEGGGRRGEEGGEEMEKKNKPART
jgi:hypothetical protein